MKSHIHLVLLCLCVDVVASSSSSSSTTTVDSRSKALHESVPQEVHDHFSQQQQRRDNSDTQQQQQQQQVTLELINSDTNIKMGDITNGTVFNSTTKSPSFNVNVNVGGDDGTARSGLFAFLLQQPQRVRSVHFAYNASTTSKSSTSAVQCTSTSNTAPYKLFDDNSAVQLLSFRRSQMSCPEGGLGYGTHTVTVTPYLRKFARGASYPSMTMTFTILQTPTTNNAPTTTPILPPASSPVRVTVVDPQPPVSDDIFNIQVDLVGIPSKDYAVFTNAAARWTSVITGDIANIVPNRTLPPRSDNCTYPTVIDDLFICGQYLPIDGPSKVLGYAAPERVRGSNRLPISGVIVFDSADVGGLQANGGFYNTILHEMGHVLGIGTLWDASDATDPAPNCSYIGTNANAEYRALSGCASAPTERTGGSGTMCVHWSESCMGNELMTGYFSAGVPMPLSRITVASLRDLGYVVNYTMADPYTIADLAPACTCPSRRNERNNLRRTKKSIMDMNHGETIPLGRDGNAKDNSSRHRRRLSAEAHAVAVQAGLDFLANAGEAEAAASKSLKSSTRKDPGWIYVGDKIVSVLVEDGGEIYGVVVRKDDVVP